MIRLPVITVGLAGTYLTLAALGMFCGPASIAPEHVVDAIAAAVGIGDAESVPATERVVVLQLRLPQVLLLGFVGAALACSGAALQATFENPLADPGVLGVTAGAALGAVLVIHTGLTQRVPLSLTGAAFLGAAAAALLVYALAYIGGRPTVPGLLLTGVAVGSMASAGVSLTVLITAPYRLQELMIWMLGGVRNQTWIHLALAAPGIVVGCGLLMVLHRRLDALLLGEEHALAVGVPVVATRLEVLALTALATGAATAVSGSIAFVGLMVPHLVRRLVGPRARDLLPACLSGGAAFLTACDLLSRGLVDHVSLHLGILTAFLGGPAFLVVLHRTKGGAP
jgi:iron complex transport system permease protein